MTYAEVMAELKALGTEQNRKVYARHGDPRYGDVKCFGVSFANIYKIQKRIKRDHDLALKLWDSGWFEARALAYLIADPAQGDAALLTRLAENIHDYGDADAFGGYAVQCAAGPKLALKWLKDKREYVQRCGWNTFGASLKAGNDGLSTAQLEKIIADIEMRIHKAPNRAREGMNYALIAIGGYRADARKQALDAAGRIGKVEVDHGETGCKTRDATEYINKMAERESR
ncbi:MAG: DNA alkylation repair protein [bacterium]|nr:DNA alkylation repair protein [bacterium]